MKLTREQAIAEHRKMWRWIAEEIENQEMVVNIEWFKHLYILQHYNRLVIANCFLCDYKAKSGNDCCIVKFPKIQNKCLGGLYEAVCHAEGWNKQAALARQIADLPEREDV